MSNRKGRNEADTRADLIDPVLKQAGWSEIVSFPRSRVGMHTELKE